MLTTAVKHHQEYAVAQIDVFSGAAFFWAEAVCWVLRRMGKPFILTLHGGNLPQFAKRWPERVRGLLKSAKAVTVPSRYLQEQMCCYRENLLLIPNAIDVGAYNFRLRQQTKPAVVWLRAFHETYNPTLAPKVLALLVRDSLDIRLTMIGPDKRDGALQRTQQIASELGVVGRLCLVGGIPKSEVPAHLERNDIFLNTSNFDNMPVSVIEAMAGGLCVASTNVGGLPYLIEEGQTGLLAPPDNPTALAGCMRRILSDNGLAERLSRNAHRQAEHFDWSVILEQWEALLQSVALTQL